MNRLKTPQEKQLEVYNKRMAEYKADSLDAKWFWYIMTAALILTSIIDNL